MFERNTSICPQSWPARTGVNPASAMGIWKTRLVALVLLCSITALPGCKVPSVLASKLGLGPHVVGREALLLALEGHGSRVTSMAFSVDGTTIASGSSDKTVRLWRVSDGTLLRELEHPVGVNSVALRPDGTILASGAEDGAVRLWQVADGTLVYTLDHEDSVRKVTSWPRERRIAMFVCGEW
jgi:WD40 repeat protein